MKDRPYDAFETPSRRNRHKSRDKLLRTSVTARHRADMEILQSCGLPSIEKTKLKKKRKGSWVAGEVT
jgi:hypothetical protein